MQDAVLRNRTNFISKSARQTIIRYFRALLFLLNLRALMLAGLGCLAVYFCDRWGLQFNMDFTLVATGTTFPLVFTIQQSFTRWEAGSSLLYSCAGADTRHAAACCRREKALTLIANLKASAVGLYFMHRDCEGMGSCCEYSTSSRRATCSPGRMLVYYRVSG